MNSSEPKQQDAKSGKPEVSGRRSYGPRAVAITTPEFLKAHTVALAKAKKKTCSAGHRLSNPANVDVGDLMGRATLRCYRCWLKQQAAWLKKVARRKR